MSQTYIEKSQDFDLGGHRQAEVFVHDILNGTRSISPGSDAIKGIRLIEKQWSVDALRDSLV